MFYLYHIKGIKWGCTKNLEQRLQRQGYTKSDCQNIIEIDDIDKASETEKELNLQYGYKWNSSQDYRVIKRLSKIGGIKSSQAPDFIERCKKGGRANKQATSTLLKYRHEGIKASTKSPKHNSKQIYECPHCNKIGKGATMFRWHYDNCKQNT